MIALVARPAVFFELIPLGIGLSDEVVFLDPDVVMHFPSPRKVILVMVCSSIGRSQ